MFSTKKNYNNEENINNQNRYQNQPSLGSISKKSTKRQMTRPNLNPRYSQIPRLNELLNDQIFQYYFRTRLKSKDYNKFKYYNETEKLNFMIELYFYIMDQANLNITEEEIIQENNEIENENEDGVDKLIEEALNYCISNSEKKDLEEAVKKAEGELEKVKIEDEVSDVVCENCGRMMVIKYGPHGKFLACPGFPECRNTKPYFEKIGVKCPECGGEIVLKRTRKGRRYFGCENNPACGFMSWTKPVEKRCPECGSYMTEKGNKLVCSDESCGHSENADRSDTE